MFILTSAALGNDWVQPHHSQGAMILAIGKHRTAEVINSKDVTIGQKKSQSTSKHRCNIEGKVNLSEKEKSLFLLI